MDYEVLMLRKACEEIALKNVMLSMRLDDLEARFEHVRAMAFNACAAIAKGGEADEGSLGAGCRADS